ncbi:YLP motif-containing protein 1-like [Topomyia yanbarensis]|uniref:YLP motif-containing protein 1-like n=1 Tax=Topomyia yanbarensis TaxID=2498891 RepID=UPI00273AD989|nr:YLP motif-containing protein 1-like [Topomyia yanbarensis]XP_058822244.1 YLP motif-containing protein 1-like [Topomyia yanbarensis]XP_058822247.1 YLP motif-containing protein 1-like [Topomyia yanbarensis]
MNSHQMPEGQVQRYESDKRAWEDAIRAYTGSDQLDIWFNYICWLEQHKVFDKAGGFRKILEQCLSNFENFEIYKQDVRMVKLWMKFIDMQANPLNLYQFLYKKNVGTQCACFYIGWAHYYDAASAFKQAESIYNLGIQVKAQPMEELQEAQNKFRLSIAQRMLYNDASSKKRSANTLVEQRQQITSLSPPQKKLKVDTVEYYQPQTQPQSQLQPQQQPQVHQQLQQKQQQQPPPPQQQPPVQTPVQVPQTQQQAQHSQLQQQQYHHATYYQHQQQQPHTSQPTVVTTTPTAASSTMTAEQYYQQDKQNSYYQNNNQPVYQHPPTVSPQTQTHSHTSVHPHHQPQHHPQNPPQRQNQPSQMQHHSQIHHHAPTATQSQPPQQLHQSVQPKPQPTARLHSQVIMHAPPAATQPRTVAHPEPQIPPVAQPHPQPQSQVHLQQIRSEQPVHKSVIIENYGLANDSNIECNLNNSAYVISSSLNYVYDDLTGYSIEEPTVEKVELDPAAIRLPANFARDARSNHERWDVPLCLEEPYDPNRKCCYPKGVVYPDLHTGKPTMEFSMEEIRARKWFRRREELEEQKKVKQQQLELEKQRQENQRRLQLQYQQQQQAQQQQQQQQAQQQQQQQQAQQQQQQQQAQQQQQQQQVNYGHPQHHTATKQRGYQPPNQYQHTTYQQHPSNPNAHHYQQTVPQQQEAVRTVSPAQAAAHYYHQHQQAHHPAVQQTQHTPVQPGQHPPIQPVQHPPIQPVQHPPIQPVQHPPVQPIQHPPIQSMQHPPIQPVQHPSVQPVQHPPIQPVQHSPVQHPPIQPVQHPPVQPVQHSQMHNNYSQYRHPYPQNPSPYQTTAVPVHQQSPVQQQQSPYQQHSPYNNHYAGYNPQSYNHSQPVHHSPVQVQSPHHYHSLQPQHSHHVPQQQPLQNCAPESPVKLSVPSAHPIPKEPSSQQIQRNPPARPTPKPQQPAPQQTHVQSVTPTIPASQPIQRSNAPQLPKPQSLAPQNHSQLRPPAPAPPVPAPTPPAPAPTPTTTPAPAPAPAPQVRKTTVAGKSINNCDDFEEQIEASTIRFSTSTENGTSKSKTITIKFKKDKSACTAPSPVTTPSSHSQLKPPAVASSSNVAKTDTSKKSKKVPSTTIVSPPVAARPILAAPEAKSKQTDKKSKSTSKSKSSAKYDSDATVIATKRANDVNLRQGSLSNEDDDSYSSSPGIGKAKYKNKSKVRYVVDEDEDDEEDGREYLDSDEDEYDDDDEDDLEEEEEEEENDSSYQSNSEFNTSFSNISFAGDNSNGAFNFGGSSCSTPLRNTQTSSGISKTSTPVGSFRFLRKHESNLSLGQNEDSMSSTMVENSYFQTEHDEEGRRRRKEKALAIIDTHMNKPFLDPFSSELCKAFLTKVDFPARENSCGYKLVNNNLPKLIKSQTACLGGTTYSIEKEVGRGSYGSVFRAVNTHTGAVVAIKYQKPANTWELYICTEVKKRIKNPEILPGFMDICSAVIAPNASALVSEFSQYGSLLDINNKIRTATTKVMHESLVMHFSSQILAIVEYLHACNIIHADIKPDNFLLMQIPTVESDIPTLRLIDFGCAIDMNFFEKKRQFKKVIQTDGFTCVEMQEGRPWSFQTDLFCVAGTIHVMLFGEYMQLTKKVDSDWEIKQKLPRYLKKHVWSEVFQKLLNIKDINHMPKLSVLKELIDGEVFNMESELVKHIRTLSNLLKRR